VGASVVGGGDGPEPLLTSRIPDLQLYRLPVKLYSSDFKVDTNCGNVGFSVCVIGKSKGKRLLYYPEVNQSRPQKQARFPDSGVSNEKELEKVVIFGIHCRHGVSASCFYKISERQHTPYIFVEEVYKEPTVQCAAEQQ